MSEDDNSVVSSENNSEDSLEINQKLKNILEAAIMVADEPLSIDRMLSLFNEDAGDPPERQQIRDALESLDEDYADRGIELKQVATGYRMQAKSDVAKWVNRLWTERPPRYTRALLETLAIIAYRQPITRGEIESIRGVSVSSNVIKTLLEREWVKVAGHRDVPGRPAVYASTKHFLSYFNLKSLSELPTLAELRDLDAIAGDLFNEPFQVMEDSKSEGQVQGDESEKDLQSKQENEPEVKAENDSDQDLENDTEENVSDETGSDDESDDQPQNI